MRTPMMNQPRTMRTPTDREVAWEAAAVVDSIVNR